MRRKLIVGAVVTALLVVMLGGAALALGPWGKAAADPPCDYWEGRIFNSETGKIRLPETDDDGKHVGFSLSAARGLLDEADCASVFEDGDGDTYWDKRYKLEVAYDVFMVQHAVERTRWWPVEAIIHGVNDDPEKAKRYDVLCDEDGGEVWQSGVTGIDWCNFRSSNGSITGDFNYNDGDYVIRGPR